MKTIEQTQNTKGTVPAKKGRMITLNYIILYELRSQAKKILV